ncbi:hypothetical protein GCM10018793_22240 [Streptomyces sulfonofaciens]|uniref:Uncharacterized protein n=1 Tax=Streptomyces sulfonofaciens TaxID=68272 RepID=A0A919G1S8_9ACTN|nr:hypothetical protein GCM10018793_22240 [Streptomyces sulfonofaciens]
MKEVAAWALCAGPAWTPSTTATSARSLSSVQRKGTSVRDLIMRGAFRVRDRWGTYACTRHSKV